MTSKGLALITGASSGIGAATAHLLAKAGYDLVLLARRQELLKELSQKINSEFKVKIQNLSVDVTDWSALSTLKLESMKVDVVVNNAGLARGTDKVSVGQVADWDQMIDTNVKGLLYVTRLVLPKMVEANHGHIVNIGSVAGRWVYPGGAVYCATKFAVRALSEGLRHDLLGSKVRVTNIEPGMVETEFSEVRFGNKEKAKAVYRGMQPLSAEDVAESILWSIDRPQHVNIQELVIYPTDQASVGSVHRKS